jgi:hypothetical protein
MQQINKQPAFEAMPDHRNNGRLGRDSELPHGHRLLGGWRSLGVSKKGDRGRSSTNKTRKLYAPQSNVPRPTRINTGNTLETTNSGGAAFPRGFFALD